jgi:predicted N-acyltransferase
MPNAGWTNSSGGHADVLPEFSASIIRNFSEIDRLQWAKLGHRDNPFLDHAFLAGLEASQSIHSLSGWQAKHLAIVEDGELLAFAPAYIKTHSHGEFVFDWAWADAYQRHGLPYYPKLLTAIPWTPVTGPRLLVRRDHAQADELRSALADHALKQCDELGLSSWHCNFTTGPDHAALDPMGLLHRRDWQFHWHNRDYQTFDDFLDCLRSRKRKNIRRERRQVEQAGVHFQALHGDELDEEHLQFVYRCYVNTFEAYGNHPALSSDFFHLLAQHMGKRLLVILAERDAEPLAMAFFLSGGGRLYGRYWGCTENLPGLHFEVAYYQGIEYCIRHGIEVFESGAQGQHKISRGFEPVCTHSRHYVANPAFRAAIRESLVRENTWLDDYRARLDELDPYRRDLA